MTLDFIPAIQAKEILATTGEWPENEWIEGLTAKEAVYHIHRAYRKASKHGHRMSKMNVLLAAGSGGESCWMDCGKAWLIEYIYQIGGQKTQFRNGVQSTLFRFQFRTSYLWSVMIWPYRDWDDTLHSDSCDCATCEEAATLKEWQEELDAQQEEE